MKRTLEQLEQLSNNITDSLNPNEPIPQDILRFVNQFMVDYTKTHKKKSDPFMIAETNIKTLLSFAKESTICEASHEKIEKIAGFYTDIGRDNISIQLVEFAQAMNTINTHKTKGSLQNLRQQNDFNAIEPTLKEYTKYLKLKCEQEGFNPETADKTDLTLKQQKLLKRFDAMVSVYATLQEKQRTVNKSNESATINLISTPISDVNKYKNSFIYYQNPKKLNFITHEGNVKEVNIKNFETFDKQLDDLQQQDILIKNDENQIREKTDSTIKQLLKKHADYNHNEKAEFTDSDKIAINEALNECMNNKPEWSERPYLQRLTDVLSCGFKMMYRHFCSNEDNLQKELQSKLHL